MSSRGRKAGDQTTSVHCIQTGSCYWPEAGPYTTGEVLENNDHTGRGASRNNAETSVPLQSCLAQLQTHIHVHEQLLSLVRQLPNELLALIFTFCMPTISPHRRAASMELWSTSVFHKFAEVSHATLQL